MSPTFSIIIPVYNVAPYLRECLDSILAQTYTDWEAICVDDGSTDGSGAILDEYAAKDERFRVMHQANAGVSAARNAAIDNAVGDYFVYIDADDFFRSCALLDCKSVLDECPSTDVVAARIRSFNQGESVVWGEDSLHKRRYDASDNLSVDAMNAADLIDCLCICRKTLGGKHFPIRRLGEDRVYVISCLMGANKVCIIDKTLSAYRQHPFSASHSEWDLCRCKEELEYRLLALEEKRRSKKSSRVEDIGWVRDYVQKSYFKHVSALNRAAKELALQYWIENVAFLQKFQWSSDFRFLLKVFSVFHSTQLLYMWAIQLPIIAHKVKLALRIVFYPIVIATRPIRHRRGLVRSEK